MPSDASPAVGDGGARTAQDAVNAAFCGEGKCSRLLTEHDMVFSPEGEPGGPGHPGEEGDELGGGAGAGGGAGHEWVAVV